MGRPPADPNKPKRFKKDGTPVKVVVFRGRLQPKPLCPHEWHLLDESFLPTCVVCKGVMEMGKPGYTNAIVQAKMRSMRGKSPLTPSTP